MLTENTVTERESGTYAVVSSRPLSALFAIVRHWDEPQRLTLEYTDNSSRTYICSYRCVDPIVTPDAYPVTHSSPPCSDELVASVLDAAANAGNGTVEIGAVLCYRWSLFCSHTHAHTQCPRL